MFYGDILHGEEMRLNRREVRYLHFFDVGNIKEMQRKCLIKSGKVETSVQLQPPQ